MLKTIPYSRLARWRRLLPSIAVREEELKSLSDEQLRKESLSLRFRARGGESPKKLIVSAFALVREASRRTLGKRHYDVQLLGGMALVEGCVAEMETGEGKTLTATLPIYLHALPARGAHLATVNDYLAQRDADEVRPLFELLGMTVGCIQSPMKPEERRVAYACDVTYSTANELGFDFLRDRLALRDAVISPGVMPGEIANAGTVQRFPHFVLLDEADSILIDEARTPLIISTAAEPDPIEIARFRWAAKIAHDLKADEHVTLDEKTRAWELTFAGRNHVRGLPRPREVASLRLPELYDFLERAVRAERELQKDRQYVVRDGKIVLVDERTGRLAEGRRYNRGLHEAIEAKEALEPKGNAQHSARVTIQDLFLRYRHLAGMTGTAMSSRRELKKVFNLRALKIPTNRPSRRKILPSRIYATSEEKWQAIAEEVCDLYATGRPVLIGTRSIDYSEKLSALLVQKAIPHQVLNARHIAREAEIVATAGQAGSVMVATNMAGRGTDIKLSDQARSLGGLHVICTELHDSARVDRQLIGRCGRQGDPGSVVQYLALDDELFENAYGPLRAGKLLTRLRNSKSLASTAFHFRRAQLRIERKHFRDRAALLYHERQRKKLQLEIGQDPYLDTPE